MLTALAFMTSCADQVVEAPVVPLPIEEQMTIDIMRWQAGAKKFAQHQMLVAFEIEAEDLGALSDEGAPSLQFHLAMDANDDVLAYMTSTGSGQSFADGNILRVQHVKEIQSIGLPSNEELEEMPENAIDHEVAASWTNQWTKDGQEWLQQNTLHSFTIPRKSVIGVLSAQPEQVIFHMALEEEGNKPIATSPGVGGCGKPEE